MNEQTKKHKRNLLDVMTLGLVASSLSRPSRSDIPAQAASMSMRDQKKKQRNRVMDKIEKKSRKINYQQAK